MRNQIEKLWRTSPVLVVTSGLMLAAFLVSLVGIWLDPRVITGAPAWLKPAKFGISTAIYSATLAWLLGYVDIWPRVMRWTGWVTAVMLVVEVAIIDLQAARGTTSHFNVATPLDAALFTVMGVSILILWLASVAVLCGLFRQHFADQPWGWTLRLAMLITVLGMTTGGLMVEPTAEQMQSRRAGSAFTLSGGHTVGAPDGGPGLPVVGWSREHGDLRVAHFMGLHAIQLLPLIVWVGRRRSVQLVWFYAGSYLALFGILLWQALSGEPFMGGTDMSADQIFRWCNLLAMAGWLLLVFAGRLRWTARLVTAVLIPGLLAILYVVVLGLHWGESRGGFGSLEAVMVLFTNRWLVLGGWVHYLAFDLFIGSWEVRDSARVGISHYLVIPCLLLTFLFGPAGLLMYLVLRAVRSGVAIES